MIYYITVATALSLFWIVLSGLFTPLFLAFGVLSLVLVLWLLKRMNSTDREPCGLLPTTALFAYLGWLLQAVVKANIDLARRILHPALPIEPNWSRLDTKVTTPLEKSLYANSITLTPGTLTTDVHSDHFMIHALSHAGMAELRAGEMERRIRRLGL